MSKMKRSLVWMTVLVGLCGTAARAAEIHVLFDDLNDGFHAEDPFALGGSSSPPASAPPSGDGNNGHGNNADGVDSSNPGNAPFVDSDPTVDDEAGGGGAAPSGGGGNGGGNGGGKK